MDREEISFHGDYLQLLFAVEQRFGVLKLSV